ncbi:hypothetical protein [Streptomyces sp. NPDC007100]|uniref:hypothetical protein n=1 Tax=Streptomyces sp. NPDC007100 TaxID=3155602 RepID=UPI0033DAD615
MSARDELIEIVTRDPESSGGDRTWATDLVAAFRAEVLREAADEIEGIDAHPNAVGRHLDIYQGIARRLRARADAAEAGGSRA